MRRNAIDDMLQNDAQRDDDVELLDGLLKLGVADDIEPDALNVTSHEAFSDMREQVRNGRPLTDRQRDWVQRAADNFGIVTSRSVNLVSRGAVPRGREVEPAPVLRRDRLPMKPPGRK